MMSLFLVAHQDDDLIFMNPMIHRSIDSGEKFTTVYLTAGDAGLEDRSYWLGREEGVRAAYSKMGVKAWREMGFEYEGRVLKGYESSDARVWLVFFRIPDGGCYDEACTPSKALEQLWEGKSKSVKSIDGEYSFSRIELVKALKDLMDYSDAVTISTHDPFGWIAGCDHVDHYYCGLFGIEAAGILGADLRLFRGYSCDLLPPNLNVEDIKEKKRVFKAYAEHDPFITKPLDRLCEAWLGRSVWRSAREPNL